MKILALETSTQNGGVALVSHGQVVAEENSLRQKSHSENINPFIDLCLERARWRLEDIDVFAVGQGPGSFTGIRVAANAAKTFSYAYGKPLVTIDSLTLLACQAPKTHNRVASMINAFKNMVYIGIFDVSGAEPRCLKGPLALPVRELNSYITDTALAVGDGYDAYCDHFPPELKMKLHRENGSEDFPMAKTLGLQAELRALRGQTLDWKSFIPLYIRASEAEETKKGILISPLK